MQISVSAMESLLVRGRRTLRARLERLGEQSRARRSGIPHDGAGSSRRLAAPLALPAPRLAAPFSWVFAA